MRACLTSRREINGQKPDPFQRLGERYTLHYKGPILLGIGKRIIKAIAIDRCGATKLICTDARTYLQSC